jgi:hypothetical protein
MTKSKKIDFEFILTLKKVHQYISKDVIIKLSLLNKYLRRRLNKRIFNGILINEYNLSRLDNHFDYNLLSFEDIPAQDSEAILNFKNINIDPFVTELTNVISPLVEYFESITYYNLDRIGYYVIPIALNFNRLTYLNIYSCYLNIKDFNSLMGNLDILRRLKLTELYLIKSPNEEFNENEIKVPSTLKEFYLGHIYTCTTNLPNTPYEFLVKYTGSIDKREFYLAPQQLPNLEKFELHDIIENRVFITNLLTLAPKLTHLVLPILNFSIQVMENLSENTTINQVNLKFGFISSFLSGMQLPILNYQRTLTLSFLIKPNRYSQVYKLIDAFLNLTKLEIELEYCDSDFITNILSKLTKLKTLKLIIYIYSSRIVDLTIFSAVEILKLCDYSNVKIIHKLPDTNCKLKAFTLYIHGRNNKYKNELVNELGKINNN